MCRMCTRLGVLAVLLLALFVSTAWAQNGRIEGRVTDENGEPLPFVNVILKGTLMGAATDEDGRYFIDEVPPGTYTIETSYIGYRKASAEVTVGAGETVTQDFTLAVDALMMEGVVVTGTRTPRAKLESSVAISTISAKELIQANPRSTTEVLRYVPGFTRVESSGGEVNQNVSVRGIYGVEFVMFMEDGMPVFPTMHTFFMNADNLFRPDENIERVEVVRGGNSALFGSNTPGAIINFINKTGGPEINGTMKVTGATKGLGRYDFNVNGPLAENWQFSLGGFYRYDHGVRDPGFPGIRGGQLKASVTRVLSNGYLRASFKAIDDRNQFILPLPFRNPEDPEYVEGFSDYGAMLSNEGNRKRIPLPFENGQLELPLDDGIRTKAFWLTTDMAFDFADGWSIQNTAQIMQNDQSWNAMVPFDLVPADQWAQEQLQALKDQGVVPQDAGYKLIYTNHFDAFGEHVPFGTPNGLLAPGGEWHVEKPMGAFHDQFQVRKTVDVDGRKMNFNVGTYFAYYYMDNKWFFTDILTDVRDNPRFVDMVVVDASGNVIHEVTKNGFRKFLSNYANGSGNTTILSGFGSAEMQLTDRFRLDLGARVEFNNFVQVSENNTTVDLDGDPATTYDVETWGDGTFRHYDFDFTEWALSGGLNYKIQEELAVFAQASRGFKMPALDEYLFPPVEAARLFEPRETITVEGGFKYASSRLGASINGYWGEVKNITGQGAEVDPNTGATIWVVREQPKARSFGAEVEFNANLARGLNILGAGTFLKTETVSPAGTALTAGGIPSALANLALTYTVSGLTFLADWHFVGERKLKFIPFDAVTGEFGDPQEIGTLKAYNYFNLGASYTFPNKAVTISLDVLNVNQSKGLEEGNPRLPQAGGKEFFLARPILPRRAQLSVLYHF